MTGLLIKDWKLFKNQGKTYLVVLAVAVFFMLNDSFRQTNMICSYLTFVVSMFAVSSFNYDEFDNGMGYLLSLPVNRKTYVTEKYVFGFLLILGSWFVANAIQIPFGLFIRTDQDWTDFFCTNIVFLAMAMVFLGYTFPLIIRYGSEKGRTSSFIFLAVIIGALYLLNQMGGDRWSLFQTIDQLGRKANQVPVSFAAGALLFGLLVQAVSYLISLRFMEKKEF